MKKYILFLIVLGVYHNILAQNVGIGTNAPNFDALLDISSTTKGVLFPRMTSTQRINIATPPNGLMVFDTDRNELYQYISATFSWRALINDSYWRRQTITRNRIGNLNDSVGIGTLSPTEWLDVDGNIRTRNTMIADGNVSAAGIISGSTLNSSGNLFVTGTSALAGNVSTNGDIILNNSGATLQLRNGINVNKGYFQISGNNVRMGTNSGNETGKLIFRNNGVDRIAIEDDGKLTTPATGDNNSMIPLCYGLVNNSGVLQRGTANVTIEKIGPGNGSTTSSYYIISCPGITATSIISVTPDIDFGLNAAARCYLGGTARVYTYYIDNQTYYFHNGFSFIIYR